MKRSIEELRRERGITQVQMAKLLGIPVSTYNVYENGNRKVPKKIAFQIAKVLQVKIEDIFLPCTFTPSKTRNEKTETA